MNQNQTTAAARLIAARHLAGKTQAQMASTAGVCLRQYGRFEREQLKISSKALTNLETRIGLNPTWILNGTEPAFHHSPLNTVGHRLRKIRKRAGLSQSDFAQSLCIALPSYQRYERDERDLPRAVAERACDLYQYKIDWLMTSVNDAVHQPSDLTEPTSGGATDLAYALEVTLRRLIRQELDRREAERSEGGPNGTR